MTSACCSSESVILLCWSYYKCFALLAGFTRGERNYSATLGTGLFSLDGYDVRNVWTRLVCGVCVLSVSSGQLQAPVKTGIWRMLFHLATCHQLIHSVPCRPFCSPSRSCTHTNKQANTSFHMHRHTHA